MNFKRIDYGIIFIVFILFTIGIFSIEDKNLIPKQTIWLFLSLVAFLLSYLLGYYRFTEISLFLYLFILILLFLVLSIGPVRSGAQRWLNILGLNLQPAEFAKLAFLLNLSRFYLLHKEEIKRTKTFIKSLMIIFPYLILIFLQPDLGSMVVLIPIFITISLIAGVEKRKLLILFLITLLFTPLFWHILKDYQKQRILVFINPNIDPLGAGYTITQSKIAIGSGRLLGKNFFGEKIRFSFLPESHTDFIFASISEKWGFLGAGLTIFLFYLLIIKILRMGILGNNLLAKMVSVGVATMIFTHVFINIGMCLGILPIVGIPLPFVSYGGSNLMTNMIALGIVNSIKKEI